MIFDNRGVGRSSSIDQSYRIEDLALDTLSLIEHAGFKNLTSLVIQWEDALFNH
ncbi:MAG: hypothetical protein HWD61_03425 [Parachlamydiaceae bacterium]|nr:MAG: hypothetical protein HWD61_03425 [Parachlamydiaceae bacterium]